MYTLTLIGLSVTDCNEHVLPGEEDDSNKMEAVEALAQNMVDGVT